MELIYLTESTFDPFSVKTDPIKKLFTHRQSDTLREGAQLASFRT